MKTIATIFTWISILYICAFILLQMKYTPPADFPQPTKPFKSLRDMKSQPSLHDGAFFHDTLFVKWPGDPLLDLFYVHTFQVVDRAGTEIAVYQGRSIINPDSFSVVCLTGVFKVLRNDSYTRELCLFAKKVNLLSPDDPAVQQFLRRMRPEVPLSTAN